MALVNCPECSAEVSDAASKCPSCGVQIRKPRRGFFGVIFKWSFILFNVLMAFALYNGIVSVSEMPTAETDAAQAGAAIGAGIGITILLGIWLAGDVILGLLVMFTRPKSWAIRGLVMDFT